MRELGRAEVAAGKLRCQVAQMDSDPARLVSVVGIVYGNANQSAAARQHELMASVLLAEAHRSGAVTHYFGVMVSGGWFRRRRVRLRSLGHLLWRLARRS
jgi:hypothetical protein